MNKTETKQNLLVRPPVVTIMGHVDHGKTSLLDAIRNARVAEKEHGGITQHIGAYQIDWKNQKITFIDTPGHAAFSQMRARGAQVTDLVILVVAADDGVMPQTKESISHIKAAGVPFIVAANKMDVPGADLNKVKKQLAENDVLVEEYGGDVVIVPVSAKTKQGLDELLDMILLVCEVHGLNNQSKDYFKGTVIESSLDRFRGPIATILINSGVLRVGDQVRAGKVKGKIRSLKSFDGKMLKEASISTPVEVMGFESVPEVGEVVEPLINFQVEAPAPAEKKSLLDPGAFAGLDEGKKEFRLIIKADVAGSLEAIVRAVSELQTPDSEIKILLKETGDITESDVYLAQSTNALILGFNVKPLPNASKLAEREKVLIRTYSIIYELLDELKEGIEALTRKEAEPEIKGKAIILALFETSSGQVVGCKMTEGEISRGDTVKLFRENQDLGTTKILSMKHLKEDISKASVGQEFGISTKPVLDFAVGDSILSYKKS